MEELTKHDIIEKCWNEGSEFNKSRLSRYRLLIETFAFNCMEELEKSRGVADEVRNDGKKKKTT